MSVIQQNSLSSDFDFLPVISLIFFYMYREIELYENKLISVWELLWPRSTNPTKNATDKEISPSEMKSMNNKGNETNTNQMLKYQR